MDVVRVGGLSAGIAQQRGDLSAVVGAMHRDVREYLAERARPRLALAVLVMHLPVKALLPGGAQQLLPRRVQPRRFIGAFRGRELWPDGHLRFRLRDARVPQPLRTDDVGEDVARLLGSFVAGARNGCRRLAVRPVVVGEKPLELLKVAAHPALLIASDRSMRTPK